MAPKKLSPPTSSNEVISLPLSLILVSFRGSQTLFSNHLSFDFGHYVAQTMILVC